MLLKSKRFSITKIIHQPNNCLMFEFIYSEWRKKISIWLNLQSLMNNDIIMSGKITYHKLALKKQQFMKNLHTHTLHDDQIEHMWWWCDECNMQEMLVVNRLLFVNKMGYSFPCVRLTFVVINLCNIVITCVLQRNNIV